MVLWKGAKVTITSFTRVPKSVMSLQHHRQLRGLLTPQLTTSAQECVSCAQRNALRDVEDISTMTYMYDPQLVRVHPVPRHNRVPVLTIPRRTISSSTTKHRNMIP